MEVGQHRQLRRRDLSTMAVSGYLRQTLVTTDVNYKETLMFRDYLRAIKMLRNSKVLANTTAFSQSSHTQFVLGFVQLEGDKGFIT